MANYFELINESFTKKYEVCPDCGKNPCECQEGLKEALRTILSRLNEAPMSDEDRRESEILRNLYKKIGGKKYTKFTPEEQEVMNKYGLDAWGFRGDTKLITPGANDVVKDREIPNQWNKRYRGSKVDTSKINYADRARKTDSRDWGRRYGNNKYQIVKDPNNQERQDQARQMQAPYSELKRAKSYYKSSKADLDNYYTDMAKSIEIANKDYADEVKNNNRNAKWSLDYHDQSSKDAQKRIDDLLSKHRRKIQDCLESLNEAPMSDEDRADSLLLKNILNKIEKRTNAALTPEEKAVLQKYGLERTDRGFRKGHDNWFTADSPSSANKNPKYNLADKVRKTDRDYGVKVRQYGNYWGKDTFQDLERKRDSDIIGKDVEKMKDALYDRKYHSKALTDTKASLDKKNKEASARRDSAIQTATSLDRLNRLKDRHQKNTDELNAVRKKYNLPARNESLTEGYKDAFSRKISTKGDPKLNSAIIASIIGQISDGIWENSPGMDKYWSNVDEDSNGNICVNPDYRVSGSYSLMNPFYDMSDNEVRRYFVNKAKYIAQLYMHDNNINPYKNWNAENNEECGYMSGYEYIDHDPTIAEIFEFVRNNK